MSYRQMVDFLDATWPVRDQIVPCLVGPVGIGKTAAVMEHAAKHGSNVVLITLSGCQPTEVSGITMPDAQTKAMEIYDHYRLGHLKDGDILFFDELLEADQYVLSACLTLIESRTMASGRKVADVQVIAACNATIQPNMLKESIRQRFIWRRFDIDRQETKAYIEDKYHIDVGDLVNLMVETGNEYNILSPRSLTKMAYWMSTAKSLEQAETISFQINAIWGSALGTQLAKAWCKSNNDPMTQARRSIKKAVASVLNDPEDALNNVSEGIGTKIMNEEFSENSLEEIMQVLQGLNCWDIIEESLRSEEVEDIDADIDF